MSRRLVWTSTFSVLLLHSLASTSPAAETNLLPNPSFEDVDGGKPKAWSEATWSGRGEFGFVDAGRAGSRCVELSSTEGGDITWGVRVPIQPFARYKLTGWIKTADLRAGSGKGALLNLHNFQPKATRAITGTTDWTQVEVEFDAEEQDVAQVNCLFGGWGRSTGKAWFDDLRLEMIQAPQPVQPFIRVRAGKKAEPLSPYVYGQFIEHLGRCIYGGIWAEMLEDRKFYFPVGHRESPWKAIGPADSVSMKKDAPFVGEHTPEVSVEGRAGIEQGALGLEKGREYVGRIWLSGALEGGEVLVSLIWGAEASERESARIEKIGPDYAKTEFRFTAGAASDDGRLEIAASGKGRVRIGTVSILPADSIGGLRRDTLALLAELDSPVYRWPGGNFVSGYDWKDGIGDRDRRPPRKNPAWSGVEHNDFGLDEFLEFCRILKTEPYIAVNSGLGDASQAVAEVEYSNGAATTPMGALRAKNGHPAPYGVKFWSIGNEMYGSWQLGHMTLEKYVAKHNEFARAMRAVDPTLRLIAVGDAGPWSEGMLAGCADAMELLSEHFYTQERAGLQAHVAQVPQAIRAKVTAHRRYRREIDELEGKDIRIAMDEWNYWYGPHVFGELGTRYFLKDALGIAAGLNEYARASDLVYMANYAQTVNVIGCIKTTKTHAAFETTGLVLKLYRKHFLGAPVETETSRGLDAQALLADGGKLLVLSVVNASTQAVDVPLELVGVIPAGGAIRRFEIAGDDPMAFNDPGKPPKVQIVESADKALGATLRVLPVSVTLVLVPLK